MDLNNLPALFSFIQTHGYGVLLILTIIEGPVTTAAGAFAASLGLMNIYIVLLISILGDIIGDIFYFSLGKFGGRPLIEKYKKKTGLKESKIDHLNEGLEKHFLKTLAIIKLTPMLAPPGIILIGSSKISFKKMFFSSLLIIAPASIFFAFIGYYFGLASDSFISYYKLAREVLLLLIVIIIIIALLIEKRLVKKIAQKIDKD